MNSMFLKLTRDTIKLNILFSNQLEPDKIRGAPLSMESFQWLCVPFTSLIFLLLTIDLRSFHSSRYPVKPSDVARKFSAAEHNHVIFVRKNKFYKVPLATPEGRELTAAELEIQVERILQLAGEEHALPVGVLTSENRDVWADVSPCVIRPCAGRLIRYWVGSQ